MGHLDRHPARLVASAAPMSYPPQYWQLRTRTARWASPATTPCRAARPASGPATGIPSPTKSERSSSRCGCARRCDRLLRRPFTGLARSRSNRLRRRASLLHRRRVRVSPIPITARGPTSERAFSGTRTTGAGRAGSRTAFEAIRATASTAFTTRSSRPTSRSSRIATRRRRLHRRRGTRRPTENATCCSTVTS